MGYNFFCAGAGKLQVHFPQSLVGNIGRITQGQYCFDGEEDYREFFLSCLNIDIRDDLNVEEVKFVADRLEEIIKDHPEQAWDGNECRWRSNASSEDLGDGGVTNQQLLDFARVFRFAAETENKLIAWYLDDDHI